MRLKSLEIDNFRVFPNYRQNLDLDHSIVLLYGRNGSGKTSICDALELLLTGTIRRFRGVDDLPGILVNARNPRAGATLKLETIAENRQQVAGLTINTSDLSTPASILDRLDAALFRHTGYLQQADLRELVTANSRQLGEIIRALAVDDAVYMLEEALSQANITRTNRNYAAVVRILDGVAAEAQELRVDLEALNSTMQTIDSSDQQVTLWATAIAKIAGELKIDLSQPMNTQEEVHSKIEIMSSILQSRLRETITNLRIAERQLQRCDELKTTQSAIDNSDLDLRNVHAQISNDEKAAQDTETRTIELQRELQQPGLATVMTDRRGLLISALEQIRSLPDLTICPVCDREFTDLSGHIASKLAVLRSEQSSLQQKVREIRARLEAQREVKDRILRGINELKLRTDRIAADRERYVKELSDLSNEYAGPNEGRLGLQEVERRVIERRDRAALEEKNVTSLINQVDDIRSSISAIKIRKDELRKRVDTVSTRLDGAENRLINARAAQERLEKFIETAQEVRRRVSNAIEGVIARFVMGHTKEAFEELFRRLAKSPFFDVTISGARVKWHAPEVSWHATYNDRYFPGGAVFSQGELNSCAIAFFLALATSHPGGLKFLMLDDPVQNMDEIHIEEFGNVLKFLKDELGWQLVISLHDESVFQFFKRQLHPSRKDQSLVAYLFEETDAGSRIVKESTVEFDPATFVAQVA
jgi:exonuclease SbcC